MKKIKDLIEELKKFDPESIVGLEVDGQIHYDFEAEKFENEIFLSVPDDN